ncbi:MAG: helix-turn-helix domain-containing protein [Rhodospirillaceae bacterium]|nr:helix-turn-helix domain-containing protein [Rhodospirillaceae bacterium]MBL6942027.1 helix-turn-helix domain-containing protein [Rhodospirillales bacterium]
MENDRKSSQDALIVAVPETAGSALYGMIDVLASAGNLWQQLVGTEPEVALIKPKIVSPMGAGFVCGNNIPVNPEHCISDQPMAPIIILPELWLAPDENLKGRYPELMDWIRHCYNSGASIYSACSGAIMLAETGLLDGRDATSHWGYQHLFHKSYPKVRFQPEPNLCFADPLGRIVTAGGTSSWHDLAIHIISRHCNPGEALRIAKVYLLKWHDEGQLPFASLVNQTAHADSAVRECETWLKVHFRESEPVARVVDHAGIPERTIKRRFKAATGATLMDHVQNLRIEEAKRLLETGDTPFDEIAPAVGYENIGFFRRLFKRRTGLNPSRYRKMFQPVMTVVT